MLECLQLVGTDGEFFAGIAFDFEMARVDFDIASGYVCGIVDDTVFDEGCQAVAYLLIVEGIEPCVHHLHVAHAPSHACDMRVERGVGEDVDGTFNAVVVHDVGMHLEHYVAGADAVEVGLKQDEGLYGCLVGGAEVEAGVAGGLVGAGIEGAIAVG